MTLEQIALIGPLINIKRSSLGDVHFWLKFHGHETELRTNRSFFFSQLSARRRTWPAPLPTTQWPEYMGGDSDWYEPTTFIQPPR